MLIGCCPSCWLAAAPAALLPLHRCCACCLGKAQAGTQELPAAAGQLTSGAAPFLPPPAPLAAGVQPSVIAQRLAFLAFENSMDKHKLTPYRWAVLLRTASHCDGVACGGA